MSKKSFSKKYLSWVVKEVKCPYCGADKGHNCLRVRIHAKRIEAYEKMKNEKKPTGHVKPDSKIKRGTVPKKSPKGEYRYAVYFDDTDEIVIHSTIDHVLGEDRKSIGRVVRLIYDCEMEITEPTLTEKK